MRPNLGKGTGLGGHIQRLGEETQLVEDTRKAWEVSQSSGEREKGVEGKSGRSSRMGKGKVKGLVSAENRMEADVGESGREGG